jgi:DNA-binding response OmpR family regulator
LDSNQVPIFLDHTHPRVLCVSSDQRLRETRRLILSKFYEAACVSGVAEVEVMPGSLDFDVVLLCHSLPAGEAERCVRIARHRWPGAKIVALSFEAGVYSQYADGVVRGLDGPRHLLATIDHLLPASH